MTMHFKRFRIWLFSARMGRRFVPPPKIFRRERRFALRKKDDLYVGITRAKKEAYLSFAMKRAYHGDWIDALPSRFINEIPDGSVENEIGVKEVEINQDNLYLTRI